MKEPKTMHIRAKDLFGGGGSTIYAGATEIRFIVGGRGRRVSVKYRGHGKPRHKILPPNVRRK